MLIIDFIFAHRWETKSIIYAHVSPYLFCLIAYDLCNNKKWSLKLKDWYKGTIKLIDIYFLKQNCLSLDDLYRVCVNSFILLFLEYHLVSMKLNRFIKLKVTLNEIKQPKLLSFDFRNYCTDTYVNILDALLKNGIKNIIP